MTTSGIDYARTQADGYDNIAPTALQGQQTWQYAQSDNFLSAEEAAAVMRQQLEPYRSQIEAKLSQIGYDPEHLATRPRLESDLFSGRQTELSSVYIAPDIKLEGRLRIVMTEDGPDIRFTPAQRTLVIPNEVGSIVLSKAEQQQLAQEGALARPLMMPVGGEYVPTYLRVDPETNSVELWRIRAEQLPTRLMGIDLTKEQQLQIVGGHAVRLTGLLDRQGEPFNATVSISPARQELQFTNIDRMDLSVTPDQQHRQQVAQNNEGAKTDLIRSRDEAYGSPSVSKHQSETVKQLLSLEPEKEAAPRIHR